MLQHQLAAPLEQLHDEIDLEAYPHEARDHGGRCATVLKALPASAVSALLESAGDERFTAENFFKKLDTQANSKTLPSDIFKPGGELDSPAAKK